MKFALKLHTQKIPGIKKIREVPGVDQEHMKQAGKVFIKKYFVDDGRGKRMIGFASKSSNFKQVTYLILFGNTLQPEVFFEFTKELKSEDYLKFIGASITNSKIKKIGEQIDLEQFKMDNLSESAFKVAGRKVLVWLANYGPIAITGLALLSLLHFYAIIAKHKAEEHYVNTAIEKDLNRELFAGQVKKESGFEMFSRLEQHLELIIRKSKAVALILCGPPGMSKTYMVRRTLHFSGKQPGKDYTIAKGSSLGLQSFYDLLYANRNRLIVLDDFDTPLRNQDIVNLLKAITDSYSKRIVSLSRDMLVAAGSQGQVTSKSPEKFEFKGQVIIVTNLTRDKLDTALISRAPTIEVSYDTKQILAGVEKLLKHLNNKVPMKLKQEVFEYIKKLYKHDNDIEVSFRTIKAGIDARVGNPEYWKELVRIIVHYKGKRIKEGFVKRSYIDVLKESVS